jgi:hypothetical protein
VSAETEPSEDQLRAAYEEELSRIGTTDMIAQTAVSLLNIGARRLAPSAETPTAESPSGATALPGQDLEQARDAIDAVRALLEILERRIPVQELRPLRDALSRLQMAYAQTVGPAGQGVQADADGQGAPQQTSAPAGAGGAADPANAPDPGEHPQGPGPAESSGRLWVPGR